MENCKHDWVWLNLNDIENANREYLHVLNLNYGVIPSLQIPSGSDPSIIYVT